MISRYIQQTLEQVVKRAVNEFPAIVLTGPRQSGKTTLLKHLFSQSHRYVSLEPPDIRAAATADPRAFLEMNPSPVIFDEIQYAPDLLPYIKEHIDSNHVSVLASFIKNYGKASFVGDIRSLLQNRTATLCSGRQAMYRPILSGTCAH